MPARVPGGGWLWRAPGARLALVASLASPLPLAASPLAAPGAQGAQGPLVLLDVPFVPQSEALCGGAAATMVMRYWGARDVMAEDFAGLVEPQLGGISTLRLVAAVEARGFEAHAFRGQPALVAHHLERGRPLIALLELDRGRRHYVVLVAWHRSKALVHDPALGAYRVWDQASLERAWEPTEGWTLLLLPREAEPGRAPPATGPQAHGPSGFGDAGACGGLVPEAVTLARAGDLPGAERRLEAAVGLCPAFPRPYRELAGVRFRQGRYAEAAGLAEQALVGAAEDSLAWRLLATSRFFEGRRDAALAAWNRVEEPVLERVRLVGLARTRPGVVSRRLGLVPRALLTPQAARRAERRLAALPSAGVNALRLEPLGSGRAELVAAVVERPLVEPWRPLLAGLAVDAASRRESRFRLTSPTRSGELLEAGVRWWSGRPAAWLRLEVPEPLGLPGVVSLSALYDEQRYALAPAPEADPVVETRRRASLVVADWWTADLGAQLALAVERVAAGGTSFVPGVRLERRLVDDRVALVGAAAFGLSLDAARGYTHGELRLAWRSAVRPEPFAWRTRIGYVAASAGSPLAYWPGAGTGTGRATLLRAHPLIQDGVVSGEAFGRRLLDLGGELEARVAGVGAGAASVAAFVDAARAWQRPGGAGASDWLVDVGAGLRLRLATAGVLRLDAATPLSGGGGLTLSAGWQPPWPN